MARRPAFFQSIENMIYIHLMNLNSLDLNLLVALDALLLEASVSRAAMRIGLSQPAASHALQRLRDLIGDPLLVRNGARMELTPRAAGAARAAGAGARPGARAVRHRTNSTPRSSERHFRLMMPDLAVELLMPPLMEKVTKAAPNVTIDVVPWRGPAIFTAEFARTIDLVISIGDAFKGFHRQRLYTDSDALAVRRGHPAGAQVEEARGVPRGSPCRGGHPRPERGSDRHLAAAARGSSGGSRWWCPAISRRCTSPRAPIWSPSCRAA